MGAGGLVSGYNIQDWAKPIVDHEGRGAIAELCRKRIDDHHYLNKISARIPPV